MSQFEARSFCDRCGHQRGRQPFGGGSEFFDRNDGPCGHCGEPGPGHQHVAKQVRVGRWPWQRGWVNDKGERVDVAKDKAPSGMLVL